MKIYFWVLTGIFLFSPHLHSQQVVGSGSGGPDGFELRNDKPVRKISFYERELILTGSTLWATCSLPKDSKSLKSVKDIYDLLKDLKPNLSSYYYGEGEIKGVSYLEATCRRDSTDPEDPFVCLFRHKNFGEALLNFVTHPDYTEYMKKNGFSNEDADEIQEHFIELGNYVAK